MKENFFKVLSAVENHEKGFDGKNTTYYGVKDKDGAFGWYKGKYGKEKLSKKSLSQLTKEEAKYVADKYIHEILIPELDKKTNNNFSKLPQRTQDGVLMMVYNTGYKRPMPNTIKSITEQRPYYEIIEAMLSGEKNSSEKNLPDDKRGYLNRLYVSTKIIAGRDYDDFGTAKQVHSFYNEWKKIKQTDIMLDCIQRIKRDTAISNEQNYQTDNAFQTINNQKPTKSAQESVSKQNNTNTTKNVQNTQETQNKGFIESLIGFLTSFTNKEKIGNIDKQEKTND